MKNPIVLWTIILFVLLLEVMIVGCQQQSAPVPPQSAPTPTPPPPTSPASTPTPSSVLVNYHRSGGIAGFEDRLTIYYDGHCELQRKQVEREFILKPNQVDHLKGLLEKANFPSLKEEYLAPVGADLMEFFITYQVAGKKYTVHTDDGAVPDALQPVIAELDQIIASNS